MESAPQLKPHLAASGRSRGLERLTAIALAAGVVVLAHTLYQNRLRYRRVSFSDYYPWSLELRLGGDPWIPAHDPSYRPHPGIPHRDLCNYPPLFLIAFEPVTFLKPQAGYWVWQAFLIVSLLSATILLVHEARPPPGPAPYLLAVAGVLLFPETYGALYESQPTFILLLLLVAAWVLDRHEHPAGAGLALAVATLLKMYPGLVGLYFLVRRRWPTVAWSVAFAIAGILLSNLRHEYELMHFGVPVAGYWFIQDRAIGILQNLRSLVTALQPGPTAVASPLGGAPSLSAGATMVWYGAAAVLYLIVAAMAVLATLQGCERVELGAMCLGIWMTAALLYSPIAWAHETPLLFPIWLGAAIVIAKGARWQKPGGALLVLGLVAMIAPYFASPLRRMHMFFFATVLTYVAACILVSTWSAETESSAESRERDQVHGVLAPLAPMKRS